MQCLLAASFECLGATAVMPQMWVFYRAKGRVNKPLGDFVVCLFSHKLAILMFLCGVQVCCVLCMGMELVATGRMHG